LQDFRALLGLPQGHKAWLRTLSSYQQEEREMQTTLVSANGPMSFPASDARMLRDVGLSAELGMADETDPRVQRSPESRHWGAVNLGSLIGITIIGLVMWTAGDRDAAGPHAHDIQPIAGSLL
jgi:hypothetical protein